MLKKISSFKFIISRFRYLRQFSLLQLNLYIYEGCTGTLPGYE